MLEGLFCLSTGGGGDIEWDGTSLRLPSLESVDMELDELSDRKDVRGSVGDGSLAFPGGGLFLRCEWSFARLDELNGLRLRRCLPLLPSLDLVCDLDAMDPSLQLSVLRRL